MCEGEAERAMAQKCTDGRVAAAAHRVHGEFTGVAQPKLEGGEAQVGLRSRHNLADERAGHRGGRGSDGVGGRGGRDGGRDAPTR